MKLLFDENLSPKLVRILSTEFPDSSHVDRLGMRGATDHTIWEYAGSHGFTIASKDGDFRQRVFLLGPPPKIIWLAVGNAGTQLIAALIRQHAQQIGAFMADSDNGLFILDRSAQQS